nr:rRNA maturation RNase YbeY [Thermotoga profunda]
MINKTRSSINKTLIKKIVDRVLKNEIGEVKVNVIFVGERHIKDLNRDYRDIDSPTDVLTFLYKDQDLFGEIFICPRQVEKNATKYKQPYLTELIRVVIHSCLHLSGYDHELSDNRSKEMFIKQEEYLKEVERYDS